VSETRLAFRSEDALGEGPVWSMAEQALYWVDIDGRRIRRATLDGERRD
jgi:sugar lactone lactonase YvrE